MDQRGGLQGITLRLILHVATGQEAQFRIDVLREAREGGFVTAAPSLQETCDFCRACVDGSPLGPRIPRGDYKNYTKSVAGLGWPLPPVRAGGERSRITISSGKQEEQNETVDNYRADAESRYRKRLRTTDSHKDDVFGNGRGQRDRSEVSEHQ